MIDVVGILDLLPGMLITNMDGWRMQDQNDGPYVVVGTKGVQVYLLTSLNAGWVNCWGLKDA